MDDAWKPMPAGWQPPTYRVIMRDAGESVLRWFSIPDEGYLGIMLELQKRLAAPSEFWLWADETPVRSARVIRLGYRRYVVELHDGDRSAIVTSVGEEPVRYDLNEQEADVLGCDTVLSTHLFASPVTAESCAKVWIRGGKVYPGKFAPGW